VGKLNRFLSKVVLVLMFVSVSVANLCFAGETDILIEKLVEKGVLTQGEAQKVLTETKEEMRKELAKGEIESLPQWLQNIKLGGDFRLRHQWERTTGAVARCRGRIRFRLGLDAKVNNQIKVAAGLATGSGDPRSTNQTLERTFSGKGINLDYAYLEYIPTLWATVKAGKINSIEKVIFRPSDLLWDSDINPEGVSLLLSKKVDAFNLFMNTNWWVLSESSSDTSDPYMYVIQPGVKYSFDEKAQLGLALAYYGFENVKGALLAYASGTNSGLTKTGDTVAGSLRYDYDSIAPSIELGVKEPFGTTLPVPYLTVFCDYVYNVDPEEDNMGYLVGLKFGSEKIKKAKDWQVQYTYRRLEKDAWLDTFPDSDAYSGKTGVQGHEIVLSYGVGKNSSLGLDYYYMKKVGNSDKQEVFQADWQLKF